MATACFCGLPAATSFLMLLDMVVSQFEFDMLERSRF